MEPGHGSLSQRFWLGRVGSRVSVSDPVFDPGLSLACAFIVAFFLQSNTISAKHHFMPSTLKGQILTI